MLPSVATVEMPAEAWRCRALCDSVPDTYCYVRVSWKKAPREKSHSILQNLRNGLGLLNCNNVGLCQSKSGTAISSP